MKNDASISKPKMVSRKSPEVLEYLKRVEKARRDAEVVTLREWFDSTEKHQQEVIDYIEVFKQLGPLGKELHKRGVKRVTERFGDNVRTLVEATYQKGQLDKFAPLCALACIYKSKNS